ncbi:MAG: amidohydrolase family protein [Anaerolineae bacterium]|nr:amidohydrolase family protein [Anaerolineae bacterium]
MIIDFHVHLSRPEHEQPWVMDWMRANFSGDLEAMMEQVLTPKGIRAYLQEHAVDLAVGLAEVSPITTGWASNEFVGEFCAQANALADPPSGPRGRLIPFASINPYIVNDLGAELQRLVDEYTFGGIKLYPPYHHHYPNDARMYPLYAKAQELGLPMLVHTGSSVFKGARIKYGDPLLLDDVAIDFPDLPILLAHSGRPFWYQQAFWMARRHPNVYMEISGLPAKKLLDYFPRLEEIADKVVYGSDWPGNPDLKRNVEALRGLALTPSAQQAILYGNAAKILKEKATEKTTEEAK